MPAIESPTQAPPGTATSGPLRLPTVKPPQAEKEKAVEKVEPTAEEATATARSAEKVGDKMFRGMPRTKKKEDAPTETDEQKKDREAKEKTAKAKEPTKPGENKDKEIKELTDEEKANAAAKAAAEKKPALKPKPEKPARPEVDIEKLVKSTIEATANATKAKEPAKKSDVDEVPDARKKEWLAIQKAEEKSTAHKGASATALKVFQAEQEYIATWKKENPGKTYSDDDGEHDTWYEKNMPKWMEDAAEAGIELSKRESIEKELRENLSKEYEPLKQKLSQLEMRDVERNVERTAPMHANQGIVAAIHALNPELLKEGVKIDEVDPVAHEVMMQYGPKITSDTHAALMLFATRGESLKDGDPVRAKIITAANAIETQISNASEEDRTAPDGKTFVNLDQWASLSESERSKHWTVTGELVAMKLANESAVEAKKTYDIEVSRVEKLAKARGWTSNGSSHATQDEKIVEQEEEQENNGKPRSPSTSAQTVIKPGNTVQAKTDATGADRLLGKMFRR